MCVICNSSRVYLSVWYCDCTCLCVCVLYVFTCVIDHLFECKVLYDCVR